MEVYTSDGKKTKIDERTNFIKVLCKKLNAEYFHRIGLIKDRFILESCMDESNIMVGNREGFDFCFVEYYHIKDTKYDSSGYISKLFLRMKNKKFPDFHLTTKKSAIEDSKTNIIIGIILFLIPTLIIMFASEKNQPVGYGFALLDFPIGLGLIYNAIDTLITAHKSNKYRINNYRFNEKYVILDGTNTNEINNLFTEEVCSRILKAPQELDITFKNHCLTHDFGNNEKLSFLPCENALDSLIAIAKLFEN